MSYLPYRWFCHIDDDVYVNIPNLVKKLHSYNPSDKRYVGYWLTNLWGSGRMTVCIPAIWMLVLSTT